MIGQISGSNQLRTSSELAPNMFGDSPELASVMEFGFKSVAPVFFGGCMLALIKKCVAASALSLSV